MSSPAGLALCSCKLNLVARQTAMSRQSVDPPTHRTLSSVTIGSDPQATGRVVEMGAGWPGDADGSEFGTLAPFVVLILTGCRSSEGSVVTGATEISGAVSTGILAGAASTGGEV